MVELDGNQVQRLMRLRAHPSLANSQRVQLSLASRREVARKHVLGREQPVQCSRKPGIDRHLDQDLDDLFAREADVQPYHAPWTRDVKPSKRVISFVAPNLNVSAND